MPSPEQIKKVIILIENIAKEYGISDVFYAGGYPRSLAMGLTLSDVHDLDIASESPERATELAGLVAEAGKAESHEILHRTGTVRIEVGGVEIDFQGSSSHDHVAPYVRIWGVEESPIAKNVFDRDFTINSLTMKIGTNILMDLTKRGISDIRKKRISSILPPHVVLKRNPLMITRAIKFSCKYGFEIDQTLWKAMKENVNELKHSISEERLAIEAYVLSKFPNSKGFLKNLGIDYLDDKKMIEKGKKEGE